MTSQIERPSNLDALQTVRVTDMQQLPVVGRLFSSIVDGTKTSTIRWNENPIKRGLMRYVNEDPPHTSVEVMVIRCSMMPLREAAAFLGRQAEWPEQVMLDGMREHYPEITLSDTVVVVEHLNPAQTRALLNDRSSTSGRAEDHQP